MVEPPQPKKRTRDKEAKIARIIDATLLLIEKKCYARVTSRDIAREAGVSNGLVFKYFPEGKPAILKELGLRCRRDTFKLQASDTVDFDDFPGFLRAALTDYVAYERKYIHLYSALTSAIESDKELYSRMEEFFKVDREAMQAFFARFKGIDVNRRGNPGDFIVQWLYIVDAAIDHYLLYPNVFASDEQLVDMLVEMSLKLWDYRP